nr:RNA-binding protein 48-like [Ipomoea batatas]
MRVNRTYPTIVGWSAELARKRVREENKAGSFGRGTVLPRISKPADIAAATSGQNDQPPVAALNIPSSSVGKVAGILQKLASTVGEFGEAMAEIRKQGAPVNVMRKTFSGLSNMLNVASTIEATTTPTSSQLDDIFFGSESFTTAVDALLQLDPTEEWMKRLPMEKKKQNFYERMTYKIDRLQNLDINDADLIFFPVLRHGHYFLICINVKASKLEIIDNKSLVSGVTMKDKYGDCTTLLVTALKEYLALGSFALFWKVDELTEEVVDMSWKESENYIDCGLFVMRHMETYKGTLKKWNPRFKKKAKLNEEFLIGLRARFLIVRNVPSLGCGDDLAKLFTTYGEVEECKPMDAEDCEPFTDVYWIKFQRVDNARFAKRKLDEFVFLGNRLQVSYAPQYESQSDTKEKLEGRRREVQTRVNSQRSKSSAILGPGPDAASKSVITSTFSHITSKPLEINQSSWSHRRPANNRDSSMTIVSSNKRLKWTSSWHINLSIFLRYNPVQNIQKPELPRKREWTIGGEFDKFLTSDEKRSCCCFIQGFMPSIYLYTKIAARFIDLRIGVNEQSFR